MEEFVWNFTSPYQLWIKLINSGKEIIVNGELGQDNHTFYVSLNDVVNSKFLPPHESMSLMETLSNRTRNDRVRIVFV